MLHIRQFRWSDYDAVAEVWDAAGRDVVPRAELTAKLTRDPELSWSPRCPRGWPLWCWGPTTGGGGGSCDLVMPDNVAGLRFWQHLGCLPVPDVLCTKPMGGGGAANG